LNCREARLDLPAVEIGAVVGDHDLDPAHGLRTRCRDARPTFY
jgi:hypothetical protein